MEQGATIGDVIKAMLFRAVNNALNVYAQSGLNRADISNEYTVTITNGIVTSIEPNVTGPWITRVSADGNREIIEEA